MRFLRFDCFYESIDLYRVLEVLKKNFKKSLKTFGNLFGSIYLYIIIIN